MTSTPDPGAPGLFRAVGLQPDGPAVLGRPIRAQGPGVYAIELPAPLPTAPLELTRIGKWIEQIPTLHLDGERPTSRALAARMASFWLPGRRVLYIGATTTSVASRVAAVDRQVLGERRPHAASQWLKALRVDGLRVWWASTPAAEEYEDALFEAFTASLEEEERAALPSGVILPWANLRSPAGVAKPHGLTGSVPPGEPKPVVPPTHVTDVQPGDAEGARPAPRSAGTTRRAPAAPRATRATGTPRTAPKPGKPAAAPVLVSAEGLAQIEAEHAALVARRPEITARIRTARELGDLKENSDYTAAREEQSFLEGRIQALEAQLRAAVVVEAVAGDRVSVGSTVTVELDGESRRFTIVGATEANAAAGRISNASPIGRALLGRVPGEAVEVSTPGGAVAMVVVSVE